MATATHDGEDEPVLGTQKREDCQYATMVLRGWRQTELGEDARHVFLHGALRDDERLGDCLIAAPLRHQRQYLSLAGGQILERVLGPPPPEHLRDDLWIERRAALGHSPNRVSETIAIRDPVFEQVADARGILAQ